MQTSVHESGGSTKAKVLLHVEKDGSPHVKRRQFYIKTIIGLGFSKKGHIGVPSTLLNPYRLA
jgi:hypothetical protein